MTQPPRNDWPGLNPDDPQHRAKRATLRAVMDALEMWRACPAAGCRRARRCVAPRVACFFHHRTTLLETVMPDIRRHLEARLARDEAPTS